MRIGRTYIGEETGDDVVGLLRALVGELDVHVEHSEVRQRLRDDVVMTMRSLHSNEVAESRSREIYKFL